MELVLVTQGAADAAPILNRLADEEFDGILCEPGCEATAASLSALCAAEVSTGPVDVLAVVAAHPGQRILVVATADTIDAGVASVIDVDPSLLPTPVPLGLTRIRGSRHGHLNLVAFNDGLHLLTDIPK
jgi:hypothetical protein